MKANKQTRKETCDLCGHEWITRVSVPVQCPNCKRCDYKKKQVDNNNKVVFDNFGNTIEGL